MGNVKWCALRCYSDPSREKDGKIRCKRKSEWVYPHDVCEKFGYGIAYEMTGADRIGSIMRGGYM